ncbi:MAG: hypothetical protein AB7F61_19695, partial [Desulfobulbus sp.]
GTEELQFHFVEVLFIMATVAFSMLELKEGSRGRLHFVCRSGDLLLGQAAGLFINENGFVKKPWAS